MKVKRVELYNFRNHANTSIDLDHINVFSGRNNSGKSSIKAAIEYALTGRCQWTDGAGRGAEDLVRDGAAGSGVKLDIESLGAVSRAIPNSLQVANWQGNLKLQQEDLYKEINAGADIIQALLNTSKFTDMKPDEQKNMLFNLMGLNFTRESILEALKKYMDGAGKSGMLTEEFYSYLSQWLPAGIAGGPEVLDGIYKRVFDERKAAKKSLKDLETIVKVDKEEVELPPGAWESRERIRADLKSLKDQKEGLLQKRGQSQGSANYINSLGDHVRKLSEQRDKAKEELAGIDFRQADLDQLERGLPDQAKKAEDAKGRLEMQKSLVASNQANLDAWTAARDKLAVNGTWVCPLVPGLNCNADHKAVLKKLGADIDAVAKYLETAREELVLIEKDCKTITARYEYAKQRIGELKAIKERSEWLEAEVKRCSEQVEESRKELIEAEKESTSTEGLDADIEKLSQRIEKGDELVQKIAVRESSLAADQRMAENLAKKEQEVEWLEALVAAFGPKGIKAQELDRVIGPLQDLVNKRMALLTGGKYTIKFDLENGFDILVTSDGATRPLKKLSTSEEMRVGIVLQDALNGLTGLRLMVIDDCETLDPGNKQLLIGMLLQIKDNYDTIIILSALGETSPKNPGIPGLSVYLVEDGTVRLIPAAQAA